MSDRIHAVVQPVKPPFPDPISRHVLADSQLPELETGDHPVLASCDLGHLPLAVGAKVAHGATKSPTPEILPLARGRASGRNLIR